MSQNRKDPPENVAESKPEFRFATVSSRSNPLQMGFGGGEEEVDTSSRKAAVVAPVPNVDLRVDPGEPAAGAQGTSVWTPTLEQVAVVPAFYPLEKTSKVLPDTDVEQASQRIVDHCRLASIQIVQVQDATVTLYTSDHVELQVLLWKKPQPNDAGEDVVLVEVQRRKGDAMAYHRYAHGLLAAAVPPSSSRVVEPLPDTKPPPAAGLAKPPSVSPTRPRPLLGPNASTSNPSKARAKRLLSTEMNKKPSAGDGAQEGDNNHAQLETAIVAMEMAHALLCKDRMDAQLLGLESLCLLTDVESVHVTTALATSHVVLLGTLSSLVVDVEDSTRDMLLLNEGPFQDIQHRILSLVQFSRMGEDEDQKLAASPPDTLTEDPDQQHGMLLHNLALAVLANALSVIEQYDEDMASELQTGISEDDDQPGAMQRHRSSESSTSSGNRMRTASSSEVTEQFLMHTTAASAHPPQAVAQQPDDDEHGPDDHDGDILETLIRELSLAAYKPHDASLSAQCLAMLCRASDTAKKRVKRRDTVKTIVATALDIGQRSHLQLETACRQVVTELERPETTTTTSTTAATATGTRTSTEQDVTDPNDNMDEEEEPDKSEQS